MLAMRTSASERRVDPDSLKVGVIGAWGNGDGQGAVVGLWGYKVTVQGSCLEGWWG